VKLSDPAATLRGMANLDATGYLARLGLPAERPGVEALRRLHAAHVERVPYEDLEIQLGRVTSLDPVVSAGRIQRGRGGYCYHLNGAFSALLHALGYDVTRHLGGVQVTAEAEAGINRNHLALTVTGLPEDPGTTWLVDVGLGDALHEPIPLREGEYTQGPHTYRLRPSEAAPGGWRLDHDPSGSFTGMDFAPGEAVMADFAAKHEWLSTTPEGGYVGLAVLLRRDAEGVDSLRALTLRRRGDVERTEVLESPEQWWTAATDVFGIPADVFTPEERDKLWRTAVAQHEAYVAGADGSEVTPSA
jgi:N-hydroxyarylamine O-acetyltransferase